MYWVDTLLSLIWSPRMRQFIEAMIASAAGSAFICLVDPPPSNVNPNFLLTIIIASLLLYFFLEWGKDEPEV